MGVELAAWTAFKAQLTGDTALATYTNSFKFNRQAKTFNVGDMPILLAYPSSDSDDNFLGGMPKRKFVNLDVEVFGKCHLTTSDADDLENAIITYNELIKNAIEKDLQLSDNANIVNVGNSVFSWLSDYEAEVKIVVKIQSKRFVAGSR